MILSSFLTPVSYTHLQGQKLERRKKNIELITNLMNSLSISFSKAVELLKVSEDEVLEIKKYFEA